MSAIIKPDEPEPTQVESNRAKPETCMKSLRVLLLAVTGMFIFLSILKIVIGMSTYNFYHSLTFFYENDKGRRFAVASLMTVITGVTMLVVALFGFCGIWKKSGGMVNGYALLLGIFLIPKLVVVYIAFTVDMEVFINYIDIPVSQYGNDPEIREEIDVLQAVLNCCGRDSYVDYNGTQFPDNSTVFYRKNDTDMFLIELPRTCCRLANGRLCTEIWNYGCKNAVARTLLHNSNRIGTLGVAAAFVQLLGTIFALNLARWIGNFKRVSSERMPSVTSNTNDQIILARHGETKTTNKETTEEKCIDPDSSIS